MFFFYDSKINLFEIGNAKICMVLCSLQIALPFQKNKVTNS